MSKIPLHYHTRYTWSGTGEEGESSVGDMPALPIGSPHDSDRFCPEHILVVAAETCLANYVLIISKLSKLELHAYESTAEGELIDGGKDGFRFKRILIRPKLVVPAGKESRAQRILQKAHDLCMVARALNCPVKLESTISAMEN